jgi:anthranilate phosphoribosyltransferase
MMTAGAALVIADVADNLKAGVELAKNAIESGAAWEKLELLKLATKA